MRSDREFTFGLLDHGAFNRKLFSPSQDHINDPLLWLIYWGMKNIKKAETEG